MAKAKNWEICSSKLPDDFKYGYYRSRTRPLSPEQNRTPVAEYQCRMWPLFLYLFQIQC